MFHFENALSLDVGTASRIINVRQTSDSSFGFRSFEHTRILIFDKPEGELFIDFAEQKLFNDCMYIIPATHLYCYTNTTEIPYLIFDVDEHHFRKHYRKLLYSIKYAKDKLLMAPGNDLNKFATLQKAFFDHNINEQHHIKTLCDSIDCRMHSLTKSNDLVEGYLALAHDFLILLKSHHISLDNCVVEPFADQLKCSIRTLRRLCFDVFNCSPSYIIKYHLMLYSVYLLAQGQKPVKVAKELGFSSMAAFDRFIKRLTTTTPSELRQTINKIVA